MANTSKWPGTHCGTAASLHLTLCSAYPNAKVAPTLTCTKRRRSSATRNCWPMSWMVTTSCTSPWAMTAPKRGRFATPVSNGLTTSLIAVRYCAQSQYARDQNRKILRRENVVSYLLYYSWQTMLRAALCICLLDIS